MKSIKVLVIDPTCPERVRANSYFTKWFVMSALMAKGFKVIPYDDITISSLDAHIPIWNNMMDDVVVAISIWSELQVETAIAMYNTLNKRDIKVCFIGFPPLLEKYGLLQLFIDSDFLKLGLKELPSIYKKFGMGHLVINPDIDDCDSHYDATDLRTYEPAFTSIGCPMGCKFCLATAAQKRVISLSVAEVEENLRKYDKLNLTTLHFFDDNFMFDVKRAERIISTAYTINPDFRFIILSTLSKFKEFLDYIETLSLEVQENIWKVLHLVEIGLETIDADLSEDMGKTNAKKQVSPVEVFNRAKCKILWLTITFFPGETISSLNKTGKFLKKYGLPVDNVHKRIACNGTEGGLGQFFAPYEGTGVTDADLAEGVRLLRTPLRLMPSWIPNSFLNSKFKYIGDGSLIENKEFMFWLKQHGVEEIPSWLANIEKDAVYSCNEQRHLPYLDFVKSCIAVAIMARLNLVVEA